MQMFTAVRFFALSSFTLVFGLAGCNGDPNFLSATETVPNRLENPSETRCMGHGGTILHFGDDANGNGELDVAEYRTQAEYCNEAELLTASEIIPSRTESPSETRCEGLGGTILHLGRDLNANGELDEVEYQQSILNCRARVDGVEALIRTTDEPGGKNCTSGGIRIEAGLDRNQNHALDDEEVTVSTYVCDGLSRITEVETVAPNPATCPQGGITVRSGDDTNGDGSPDLNVIERRICNGERSLVRVNTLPAGPACLQGGITVSSGFDRNNNRALDDGEIDTTEVVCNGIDGLTALTAHELLGPSGVPTAPCFPFGGTRIKTGLDLNRDRVLQATEVQTTSDVCTVRVNTNMTLVRNLRVEPGTQASFIPESVVMPRLLGCQYGGVLTQVGMDDNDDHVLQSAEVDSETVVCNQIVLISGNNSLIDTSPAPSATCPTGGITFRVGVDTSRNGLLETSEVQSTRNVCNGFNGLVNVQDFAAGAALSSNCDGTAGLQIQSGIDRNGDAVLQSTEVLQTRYVCDGALPVMDVQESSFWAECGTGGARIQGGYDANGNARLDSGEVEYTRFVCDGLNGADGLDSAVRTTESNSWPACSGGGGVRVQSGIDLNGNGILDTAEIVDTTYVCDGLNGINGADGADGLDGFNGKDGADALVETFYGYIDSCGGNGTLMEVGTDYNHDGVLGSTEISNSFVFCDESF